MRRLDNPLAFVCFNDYLEDVNQYKHSNVFKVSTLQTISLNLYIAQNENILIILHTLQ